MFSVSDLVSSFYKNVKDIRELLQKVKECNTSQLYFTSVRFLLNFLKVDTNLKGDQIN